MIKIKGCELKERMIRAGFTDIGLARAAGISQCYVSLLLAGKRNMSPLTAKKIREALHCDFDDIFVLERDVLNGKNAYGNNQ